MPTVPRVLRCLPFLLCLGLLSTCGHRIAIDDSLSTPHQRSRINYLVLHYTVTNTPESIRIFTGKAGVEASIHYLVTDERRPVIYSIVDEERTAYHAGADSCWKQQCQLNDRSIGIEIVNAGWTDGPDGRSWAQFPPQQIESVVALVKDIMARHRIPPEHVLGHSDIVPQRKQDPGARFPWKRLADEGLVPWPHQQTVAQKRIEFEAALPDIAWFQSRLAALGYQVPQHGQDDVATRNVLIAFQTRYRPAKIDGVPDAETAALLDAPMLVAATR